jgi:two-component system CheB/CheR fusion protein
MGHRTMILNAHSLSSTPDAEPMILLAIEDISERTQTEAALRESEEKYRALFESIDEGFCIIEEVEGGTDGLLDFRYVAANPAFEKQSGVGGVVGKTMRQVFPGEPEEWFQTYDAVVKTGNPIRFERNLGTQGRELDLYASRIEDASHRPVAVIFKDITGRKQAELALARLAAIVECSDDAIIGKDLNGIIQTWNAAAERLFGYTQREAIGQPVLLLIPPERADEEPAILERIRHGEHVNHYEAVRRRKDGRLLDVSLTISPIFDAHGQIVGASKIARDITGRKLAEAALIKSEKLAAAGRLAATLAHEINNPLQAVTNLMSLLGNSPRLDPHERAFAAMAEEELSRVVRLTQQSRSFFRE